MVVMDLTDDELEVIMEEEAVDLWHSSIGEWPAHFVDGAPVCYTNATLVMRTPPGAKGTPPAKQKTNLRLHYYFVGK